MTPSAPGAARQHRRGLIAVIIAAVIWSIGGLFIKWVSVDAFVITQWRSLFAAATIAIGARPDLSALRRAPALSMALVLSYALTLLTFVAATRLTTAANAIFLQYTAPLWVAFVGFAFLRQPPTRLDLATLVVAFGGMGLFFLGKLEPANAQGNLIALASGVFFSAFLLLLRHPRANSDLRIGAMVAGNVLLCLSMVVLHLVTGKEAAFLPSSRDLAALAILGIFQIGIAYIVFNYGIARVASLEASLLGMVEPVLNPLWVFLVLGELPGIWASLGGTIILGALAVRTVVTERRGAKATPAGPTTE